MRAESRHSNLDRLVNDGLYTTQRVQFLSNAVLGPPTPPGVQHRLDAHLMSFLPLDGTNPANLEISGTSSTQ